MPGDRGLLAEDQVRRHVQQLHRDDEHHGSTGSIPKRRSRPFRFLLRRIIEGEKAIKKGEILIPELLARGMKVKVGDMVVIIATNKDGSVNGKQFKVGGHPRERHRARADGTATSTSTMPWRS